MKKERLNIALVGGAKVGKTCLLSRYLNGKFSDTYRPTIPGDFLDKEAVDGDSTYSLRFWDIGAMKGVERTLRGSSILLGIDVAFVVFSVNDAKSFYDNVDMIADIIHEKRHGHCDVILVANKTDVDDRYLSSIAILSKAQQLGLQSIETSAKNGHNIDEMFRLGFECCKRKLEERANMEVFILPDPDAPDTIEGRSPKSCCAMM